MTLEKFTGIVEQFHVSKLTEVTYINYKPFRTLEFSDNALPSECFGVPNLWDMHNGLSF